MELSFKTLDFDKGGDLDAAEISGYLYRLMEEIRKDKGGQDRYKKVGHAFTPEEIKKMEIDQKKATRKA